MRHHGARKYVIMKWTVVRTFVILVNLEEMSSLPILLLRLTLMCGTPHLTYSTLYIMWKLLAVFYIQHNV